MDKDSIILAIRTLRERWATRAECYSRVDRDMVWRRFELEVCAKELAELADKASGEVGR